MEGTKKETHPNPQILQSPQLKQYIMETSLFPREPVYLQELREATKSHPTAFFSTAPEAGQLMAMLMKMIKARKTIEIGVFTGYSLLLTALTVPDDGQITAIDIESAAYQLGLPIIQKAGVDHKINFIQSQALPILDELLENRENEGSFDFAFVDADKNNYWKYHERLMKLIRIGGIVVYDNTLWGGSVALPEEAVPDHKREIRRCSIEFNRTVTADPRVEISLVPLGDGITICRRIL